MKKILIILVTLFSIAAAHSQSALCLQFLPQKNIQTYCVDNYPLGNDDSINVTFLMAADSDAYNTIVKYLFSLPKQKQPSSIGQHSAKNQDLDNKKYFIIRFSSALPSDKGRYLTFFSPYNLSAMVFQIRNDKDMEKVLAHVLTRETTKD
ncbi:MAG: hypothetical protein IKR79_06130 [Bacteroidales bacterium]|nr:hypothetical protein [Bacteroidales bacterium]